MKQLKYRENLNMKFKKYEFTNIYLEEIIKTNNIVSLFFNCKKIIIKYINNNIVKVFIGNKYEEETCTNAVIVNTINVNIKVEDLFNEVIIKGENIITVINKNTCEIDFRNKENKTICKDFQPSFKDEKENIYISKVNDCYAYYGLGEKGGELNKKGCYTENFNTDDPETDNDSLVYYKSIPFYVGLKKNSIYGIFFDNSFRSFFDMGKSYEDRIYFGSIGGQIQYYFINGKSIKEVVSEYSNLTGKIEMPPMWSLGYQQNRFSYTSEEEIEEVINTFKEKSIPIDVIYLDIDYMDGFRVMTFKVPEFKNIKNIIKEIKSRGVKTVTIIDPGVKVDENYNIFKNGLSGNHFVKNKDGSIFLGHVWPNESAFPDFSNENCRQWWKNELKTFMNDYCIDGLWNDMNEPCVFNNDYKTILDECLHNSDNGVIEHKEFHNRYGFEMSRCSYEAQKELNPNIRGFSMTRATYAGGQRYSSIWTGDNRSLWSQMRMSIPMNCNLGISGFPFVGNDVGGFGLDCTEELFIRWMQLGTFLPIYRNHSNMYTRRQEPWSFGKNVEEIVKKSIKLRYKLLPYIYTCFYESYMKGIPVFRPLIMEFEKDENVLNIKEEFMFGGDLLICPVLYEGERSKLVYLPKGKWYEFNTNNVYEGENTYKINCDLNKIIFFVRMGSIIPTYEEKYMNVENRPNRITFRIYGKDAEGMYYYDDGITNRYKEGYYNLSKVISRNKVVNHKFINKKIKEEDIDYIFID